MVSKQHMQTQGLWWEQMETNSDKIIIQLVMVKKNPAAWYQVTYTFNTVYLATTQTQGLWWEQMVNSDKIIL
jgi:beta-galactosidase GanA